MNKTDTINEFQKRIDYQNFVISRMKNIVALRKYKDVEDIYKHEERFGEFFYSKDIDLSGLLGGVLFDRVSDYYLELKDKMNKLYIIFVADGSNPKKIKLNKIGNADYDIANAVVADLLAVNEKFNEYCKSCFDRLYALSESRFPA